VDLSRERNRPIARNRNTYAKRQREFEKKQRADDKRLKREQKKDRPTAAPPFTATDTVPESQHDQG